MITLSIKNSDGSTYWIEHFEDQKQADAYVALNQKTWKSGCTYEFTEQIQAARSIKPLDQDAMSIVKSADPKTLEDVIATLNALLKVMGLK